MWLTCSRCGKRFEASGRGAHCPTCPPEPATDDGPINRVSNLLVYVGVFLGLAVFAFGFPSRRAPFGGGFKPLFFCAGVGIFVLCIALSVIVDKVSAALRARRRSRDYQGPSQ